MHQTYREHIWNDTEFAQFYQEHASPLLDYLCSVARILEDAEDILVDVFLAARQAPQIAHEAPRGQFAWLRQVAHNKLVDYYRRPGQAYVLPIERARSISDQESAINPEQALVQAEMLEHLQHALQCLTAPQQELLRLRFTEGLRSPQIAVRLGKREGAVRTMLVRTLKTLRGRAHAGQAE